MVKSEKIIILGPSGSGKDFLLKKLVKKGLRYYPKFTTRPKRKLEVQGVEYDFIDIEKFNELKNNNELKVYQQFTINDNVWYYGITKKNFEKNQAFIMTPYEFSQLNETDLKGTFVVYLDIDKKIRESRIINRNDISDSLKRRLDSDEYDFKNFNVYDLKITDPEFDPEWVYEFMN